MTDNPQNNREPAQVVSLSKARKTKQKQARKEQAAENRVKFGRTGAQKKSDKLDLSRTKSILDGKKIDDD